MHYVGIHECLFDFRYAVNKSYIIYVNVKMANEFVKK